MSAAARGPNLSIANEKINVLTHCNPVCNPLVYVRRCAGHDYRFDHVPHTHVHTREGNVTINLPMPLPVPYAYAVYALPSLCGYALRLPCPISTFLESGHTQFLPKQIENSSNKSMVKQTHSFSIQLITSQSTCLCLCLCPMPMLSMP